jgi:hypothetical protein
LSERIYIVIQYDTYISGIIYGNEMNKKKTWILKIKAK